MTAFFKRHWALLLVLAIAAVAHGANMFNFPYYENDEGTYMSQAWSLLTSGQLAPYTYWYDHAPAGWILIAAWVKLTGGFFTFGTSVDSGRVLMLVLQVASTFFLYGITRRLTGRTWPAVLAALAFSLSPLAIYFHRRVLLDNIMTFWVLLSLWLLVRPKIRMRHVIFSALAFGVAVLSKENAIFFAPAFLVLLWQDGHARAWRFMAVNWLAISGLVASLYFLYAFLNSELFPVGFLGNDADHVSLLKTLKEQAGRGSGLPFWERGSEIYGAALEWLKRDPFLMVTGLISTLGVGFLAVWNRYLRVPFLLTLLLILFYLRGGLVIDFYVVPLIPFLALMIALFSDWLVQAFQVKRVFFRDLAYPALALGMLLAFGLSDIGQYTRDETAPQVAAVNWTKANVPADSNMVIDGYGFVEYRTARFAGDPIFPNAHWFWKITGDPEIGDEKFNNDWQNLNYVALSHEMLKQVKLNGQPLIKQALANSVLVEDWYEGSSAYRDLDQHISTNGDWMSFYQLRSTQFITMRSSWDFYKQNYIHNYGQVIDPSNRTTTSEAQSYALLRAVLANDKPTFDGVLAWTKDHMQHRTQDKLFSWLWQEENGTFIQKDHETASDADVDIAWALILASQQFGEPAYLDQAREIIPDIWEQEVVRVGSTHYLTANTNSRRPTGYLLNPSYFSPAAYRAFAELDPTHPWGELPDDTYTLLNRLADASTLPPNWLILDANNGTLKPAGEYVSVDADVYGFDAFRVLWHVGLDAKLYENPAALAYLNRLAPFFRQEWETRRGLSALYGTDGQPTGDITSLSTDTAAIFALHPIDRELAMDMFTAQVQGKFDINRGVWGDGLNYYDQNWAWFASAYAYDELLPLKYKPN